MKKALCIITKNLILQTLDFLNNISEYDVFIMIDENLKNNKIITNI
jgi:hypothetical protein